MLEASGRDPTERVGFYLWCVYEAEIRLLSIAECPDRPASDEEGSYVSRTNEFHDEKKKGRYIFCKQGQLEDEDSSGVVTAGAPNKAQRRLLSQQSPDVESTIVWRSHHS
jgi:hypothetical protein